MLLSGEKFSGVETVEFLDWGTIEDWNNYKSKYKCLFIDIDGTLITNSSKHFPPYIGQGDPLTENINLLKNLQKTEKAYIVLTTSRSSSFREKTINELSKYGIPYDQLIMDLPHCQRLLINDYSLSNPYPTATSINLIRNSDDLKSFFLNMKIILTGAAGGIGSTLGSHLFKSGHDLTLIDNLRNGYLSNLLCDNSFFGDFINKSITDPSIENDLNGNYDCLIHLAAVTALPDCQLNTSDAYDINVTGTALMLEIARKMNIPKVIFASTSAVYENNKEEIFKENLDVNPNLNYSLSKYMAEKICSSYRSIYDMKITILRFFNVFGPRQDIHRKKSSSIKLLSARS